MAVPPLKLGVTWNPPETASFSVTVNVRESPSSADASPIVTAAATAPVSSSKIVPVAVSVAVTVSVVPEIPRLTMNVSSSSGSVSPLVCTQKDFVSPLVPVKASGSVFAM